MNARALIGESLHRAEDFRFLKGTGSFVDDLKRDGMLHAVVFEAEDPYNFSIILLRTHYPLRRRVITAAGEIEKIESA